MSQIYNILRAFNGINFKEVSLSLFSFSFSLSLSLSLSRVLPLFLSFQNLFLSSLFLFLSSLFLFLSLLLPPYSSPFLLLSSPSLRLCFSSPFSFSLSLSLPLALSRDGNSVARRGGRKSLPLFSLFFLFSFRKLFLSLSPLFPLSPALPSLSREGNFSVARGVSLLPFFHFLFLSLTFSFFSSASLLAFPGDGNYFRRERTAGRTLISLRPLPLLAPLLRAREGEIMATENNSVASLLLATERGTSPSLSSFLLSPALSLFISSSPRSLSPSLLASSYFSRNVNFPRGSFLRCPSLVLFLSSSASSFIAWRIALRPVVLRDQERERKEGR